MDNMDELLLGLSSLTFTGVLVLWLWFFKWKKSLHYEIVRPDVAVINEHQNRQDARLQKLEKKYEELDDSIAAKIDAIMRQQMEITKDLAVVTGKLELIVENLRNDKR